MLVSVTRFVGIFCAALAFGLTLTTDLKIQVKRVLKGAQWLGVQHSLYGGSAVVGRLAEAIGLISVVYLLDLPRQRRSASILTPPL